MALNYDKVKQAIQEGLAPKPLEVMGEIARLRAEVTGLRGELRQLERRLEDGMSQLNRRIDENNKRFDEAINIRERLAALEAAIRITPQHQ